MREKEKKREEERKRMAIRAVFLERYPFTVNKALDSIPEKTSVLCLVGFSACFLFKFLFLAQNGYLLLTSRENLQTTEAIAYSHLPVPNQPEQMGPKDFVIFSCTLCCVLLLLCSSVFHKFVCLFFGSRDCCVVSRNGSGRGSFLRGK